MPGPAGPDPATLDMPGEAVEGTQSPPGKELPGGEKEKKVSKKRKRGGEEGLNWPRLRPVKLRCTTPPPIRQRVELHGAHQAMGTPGGGGGGGTYKINGKINNYY